MKNLFLALLCLWPCRLLAQSNVVAGYVVTNEGDTLRGQIDNRDWRVSPTEITFQSQVGQTRNYVPADLREFYIQPTHERFLGRVLAIDAVPFGLDELLQIDSPTQVAAHQQQRTEPVFLRVLTEGPTRLLFYQGKTDKPHFFLEKEGQIQELINQRFLLSGTAALFSNAFYKDQLISYLADCPQLRNRIANLDYNQVQLANLLTAYNRCKGFVEVPQLEKGRWAVDLLAGVEFSQLNFSGDGGPGYLRNAPLSSSTAPMGGLAVAFYPARSREQFSYRLETTFRTYETQGVGEEYIYQYDIRFKLSYLRLNALMRYTYPKGKIRPFAGIGVANGLTVSRTNQKILRSTTLQNEGEALPSPRSWELGLMAEAGLSMNRFQAIYRREWSNGFSSLSTLRNYVTVNSVLLGYRLLKK